MKTRHSNTITGVTIAPRTQREPKLPRKVREFTDVNLVKVGVRCMVDYDEKTIEVYLTGGEQDKHVQCHLATVAAGPRGSDLPRITYLHTNDTIRGY